jgi:hypothetical protein
MRHGLDFVDLQNPKVRRPPVLSFAKTAPTFTDQEIWPEALMRALRILGSREA